MNKVRFSLTDIVLVFVLAVFVSIGGTVFAGQGSEGKASLDEVRQEVDEAVKTIGNYSVEQRDKALKKVKTAIDNLDERIEVLETQIQNRWEQMDRAAQKEARSTLKTLRKKRNELAEWYGGMRHSSINAWDHVKKGFIDSYKALSEAYEKAVEEF